jgi:hypothetical protein
MPRVVPRPGRCSSATRAPWRSRSWIFVGRASPPLSREGERRTRECRGSICSTEYMDGGMGPGLWSYQHAHRHRSQWRSPLVVAIPNQGAGRYQHRHHHRSLCALSSASALSSLYQHREQGRGLVNRLPTTTIAVPALTIAAFSSREPEHKSARASAPLSVALSSARPSSWLYQNREQAATSTGTTTALCALSAALAHLCRYTNTESRPRSGQPPARHHHRGACPYHRLHSVAGSRSPSL